MSLAVTAYARLHRLALAEIGLGVERHRGGDDRRHLLDPELLQRRIRRRLDVGLLVAAVVLRLVRREIALAVPRFGQHRKMPDGVHLGALGAGLAAHRLLAVEGVRRAGNADGRPILVAQRHAERRLRHGVRAQMRNLVGLGFRICQRLRAALPGGGAERIGHPDFVAGAPPRRAGRVLRLGRGHRTHRRKRTQNSRNGHRSSPMEIRRLRGKIVPLPVRVRKVQAS